MLIKPLLEADGFMADLVPTATVNTLLSESAAKAGLKDHKSMQARRLSRQRRQSRLATNHIGGWKVRMW